MATFTDNVGDTWTITLTLKKCKQIRDDLGINLGDLSQFHINAQQIAFDMCLMGDLVSTCCEERCNELGLTVEQFAERIAGEGIYRSGRAFLEALADFYPPLQKRAVQRMIEELEKAETTAIEKLETMDLSTLSDSDVNSQLLSE